MHTPTMQLAPMRIGNPLLACPRLYLNGVGLAFQGALYQVLSLQDTLHCSLQHPGRATVICVCRYSLPDPSSSFCFLPASMVPGWV